jgi:hypothetical protein
MIIYNSKGGIHMKRITAVFMLLCLLLTALPVGVFATETAETTEATEVLEEEIRTYNQCGPDLTWQFDGSTLTISGTGEMDHYPDGDAPWLEYKDNIEKLVFTGGVTSMFMDEGLDTGDIILKKETPVGPDETSGELFDRLCLLGADCLAETLALIAEGKAPRTPQNHDEATLAPILNKEMARIDFSKTAREVHNLVRGMSPWPTAFTKCGEKLLKVHQSRLVPELEGQTCGQPGQLIGDGKDFVVACGSGALRLTVVQLEGKGRLDGETFLRGSRLEPGFVLG